MNYDVFVCISSFVLVVLFLLVSGLQGSMQKKQKFNAMTQACSSKENLLRVMLLADCTESFELAAECLFSVLQNAKCPKLLDVHLYEYVLGVSVHSNTLERYKELVQTKGTYTELFLDQIIVHQIQKSPYVLEAAWFTYPGPCAIATEKSYFLSNWDDIMLSDTRKIGKTLCFLSNHEFQTVFPRVQTNGCLELKPFAVSQVASRIRFMSLPCMSLNLRDTFSWAASSARLDDALATMGESMNSARIACITTFTYCVEQYDFEARLGFTPNETTIEKQIKYGSLLSIAQEIQNAHKMS